MKQFLYLLSANSQLVLLFIMTPMFLNMSVGLSLNLRDVMESTLESLMLAMSVGFTYEMILINRMNKWLKQIKGEYYEHKNDHYWFRKNRTKG